MQRPECGYMTLPVSYFNFGYFCLEGGVGGGGGRVRCFCAGVCEGPCINPFYEVGGPRLFLPEISKIPWPTPTNQNRTFP